MKRGRSLEILVAHLEKVLGYESGTKVESPKRLVDRFSDSRRSREHDVVISVESAHHRLTIALECRDRSRPVGVSQVEAFYTKCNHTGVDQGVIVSSRGFCESAKEKAEKLAIRCLSLEQATSFDWLLTPGIQMLMRRPKKISITAFVDGCKIQLTDKDYALVDSAGKEVLPEAVLGEIMQAFENTPWEPNVGGGVSELTAEPHGLYVREGTKGKTVAISKFECRLEYDTTVKLLPFKLLVYADEQSGNTIAETAVAELATKQLKGSIVVNYNPAKGGGVYFVSEQQVREASPNTAPAADGRSRR